jgi:hypothetical protein
VILWGCAWLDHGAAKIRHHAAAAGRLVLLKAIDQIDEMTRLMVMRL